MLVASGMPRSRSSSLSRSNIRSKASVEAVRPYCGTASRICALVSGRRVLSRQITRLSRRSVLARWTAWVLLASTVDRHATGPAAAAGLLAQRSMPTGARWRGRRGVAVGRRWTGAVELDVAVADRAGAAPVRALAYPGLVGTPAVGDRVLLNVTALERGPGHRRLRPGRGAARTGCPPTRTGRAGPPGQGALHPAAGDGAGRRRAGLAAPRRRCATRTTWAGCRSSSPTCTPPLPAVLAGLRARAGRRRGSPT